MFRSNFYLAMLVSLFVLATSNNAAAASRCDKFQPGMEFRVEDDATRGANGLSTLKNILTYNDVINFKGVFYQINWGMLETSPGKYDWTRLDQAFELAKSQGKHFRVRVQDRTFQTGCNSAFIPSDILRDGSPYSSSICYAQIWESSVMTRYIALLTAIANRYNADPYFLGIATEETALDSKLLKSRPILTVKALYVQLKRLATAIHTAQPQVILTQYINWPYALNNTYLAPIVSNLASWGGIGWPDTIVANENTWSWYQFARDNYTKMLIAPSVESGSVPKTATLQDALIEHQKIYQMLNERLHANIIVWDTWNSQFEGKYFTDVVIPTVNNYRGKLNNNTCPFAS
jgi:hypothetical protein